MKNINIVKEEIMQLESQLVELTKKYGLTATPEEQGQVIELGKELEHKRAQLASYSLPAQT